MNEMQMNLTKPYLPPSVEQRHAYEERETNVILKLGRQGTTTTVGLIQTTYLNIVSNYKLKNVKERLQYLTVLTIFMVDISEISA